MASWITHSKSFGSFNKSGGKSFTRFSNIQSPRFNLNNTPSFKRQLHIFNEPPDEVITKSTRDNFIPDPEKFEHRLLLNVGRHTKVTRGGRIFSISVLLLIGDGAGTGGIGYGKGETYGKAMQTAAIDAQKNCFTIDLYEGRTISNSMVHKFRRSIIYAWSLPKDRGMLCNNIFRRIAEAFGIKDIRIKSQGSRNPHNM